MNSHPLPLPELRELIALFYDREADLGEFRQVTAADMPAPYQRLLAHSSHMTVTVEEFHGGPVDVEVLDRRSTVEFYFRKILLRRRHDRRPVQFGIPRLRLGCVDERVRRLIEAERLPLGRVLIEQNVLREVELVALWQVVPGPDLCRLFDLPQPQITFGRTALIRVAGEPAVELLEIVAPVDDTPT